MSRNWRYNSGDWNLTCDVCSKKIKASDSLKRWDGLVVCPDDWEPRHSQDFVRARNDKISVPYTRSIPENVFRLQEGFSDSISFDDGDDRRQNYVDQTYFLEDYIGATFQYYLHAYRTFLDTSTITDSPSFVSTRYLTDSFTSTDSIVKSPHPIKTDSITTTDAGSIVFFNYIDATYFAADYVGTSYTF